MKAVSSGEWRDGVSRFMATVETSLSQNGGHDVGFLERVERAVLSRPKDWWQHTYSAVNREILATGLSISPGAQELAFARMGQRLSEFSALSEDDAVLCVLCHFLYQRQMPPLVVDLLMFSARWFAGGLPTLCLTGEQVAAFALSDMDEDHIRELHSPWRAFVIRIPGDSMPCVLSESIPEPESERFPESMVGRQLCQLLFVESFRGQSPHGLRDGARGTGAWQVRMAVGGAELRTGIRPAINIYEQIPSQYDWSDPAVVPNSDLEKRAIQVGARVAFNAVSAIEHHGAAQRSFRRDHLGKKRPLFKQPLSRSEFVVGSTVKVDVRPALWQYLEGRTQRAHKVRWLVRGHWRNQAHGQARAQRKRLWIEPHWKGEQFAPTNLRGHEL